MPEFLSEPPVSGQGIGELCVMVSHGERISDSISNKIRRISDENQWRWVEHGQSFAGIVRGDVAVNQLDDSIKLSLEIVLDDSGGTKKTPNYLHLTWTPSTGELRVDGDPFRRYPLYYHSSGKALFLSTSLLMLTSTFGVAGSVSPGVIYDYLNFGFVPAGESVFEGIKKTTIGTNYLWRQGKEHFSAGWLPEFSEDLTGTEADLEQLLFEEIEQTVSRYCPEGRDDWGAFNSGGTDSAAISGILSRATSRQVNSFSIGFDEDQFDELEYARLAEKKFGLKGHYKIVTANDALEAMPNILAAYDEPFGNSSAVATYFCAKLAKENGVSLMVAGDGGDEIFGGNTRYAKNKLFSIFHAMGPLLQSPFRGLAKISSSMDSRLANRITNFVHRGSLPNPERLYSDDSFASDVFDELFDSAFAKKLTRESSLDRVREIFDRAPTDTELHKLMFVDQLLAVGVNDLTKVNSAAQQAGVSVVYPYLDPHLVNFAGRLPEKWKVKNFKTRYLYKRAMRRVLPDEILNKTKHGFALPIGNWISSHQGFRELFHDAVFDSKSLSSEIFQRSFIESLLTRHDQNAWDFSGELWSILMLELWHQRTAS